MILVCRLVTPQRANVNVAFAIYAGLEKVFSSHLVYLVIMMGAAAVDFLALEYVFQRWLCAEAAKEGVL